MATLRDTQRNRIYRAEESFNQTLPPSFGREDLWRLDHLAQHITARSWWKKQAGPEIEVLEGRAGWDCIPVVNPRTRGYQALLAPSRQTRLHLLHTMTHCLLDSKNPSRGIHIQSATPHDPEFVKLYLEMVRRFQNGTIDEDRKRLFKSFLIAERVKTKAVSEATREKQREAMLTRMTPTMESSLQLLKDLEDM